MEKIMTAYAQKRGVAASVVRFFIHGTRIEKTQTAEELGLEDQDQLDAMLEQTGGV
jgi:hypothetical protein